MKICLLQIWMIMLCLPGLSHAQQSFLVYNGDTINVIDDASKKQGHWIVFNTTKKRPGYSENAIIEEGQYIDNKKTGIWKDYYPGGTVKNKITFENGRPHGHAVIYYENGKKKEEGTWKNNRWVDEYKMYYENGCLAEQFDHNTPEKTRIWKKYSADECGKLISIDTLQYTADGKRMGKVMCQYPESTRGSIQGDWKTGKDSSVVVNYHKLYNKNKQLSKDGEFRNNRLINGKAFFYDSNGVLKKMLMFMDGKQIAEYIVVDGETRIWNGKIYYHDDSGKLTRIAIYKEGKYISDAIIEE